MTQPADDGLRLQRTVHLRAGAFISLNFLLNFLLTFCSL
jgi:hypothetical protein